MKYALLSQKATPPHIGSSTIEKTIGNNPKPYTPVYAELKVIDTGKSNEGFAAEYAGVYHVKEVLNISPIKPE